MRAPARRRRSGSRSGRDLRGGEDGGGDPGDVLIVGDVGRHRVHQVAKRSQPHPAAIAARVAAATSTGASSWTTPIAPRTRTSTTPGSSRAGARPSVSPASMRATSACHDPSASSSVLASATAHASGLAMNVGPCISAPPSPPEIVAATSLVQRVAANGRYPPLSALPTHITSAVTPAWSLANSAPVRPNPVAISSRINSSSWRSHSSRRWRTTAGL